jgi:RHS repeat-associated protein
LTKKLPSKCSAENLNEYADWTNRLHTFSGLDNWYDAAGNVTLDATTGLSYSYDAENRITGAGGYAYTYDSDGNRVKKSNGSTGTIYWYMSPGIVGESDLNGNPQSEYVFFGGERVARKDFPSNAVSYYFSDDLKTASLITDSTGTIKEDEDYYPWGGELQFVNNDSNHYKFTGKERDAETGLDYFGARYYGNWTGRFLSADSKRVALRHLLNPQKLNKYAYVLDNPLSEVDPDGLEDIKVFVHFNPGDTMPQNQPNWGKIQETARAHGNTVTVYQDDNNATAANYQSSLAAGGTTVFIGHTQSVDNGPAYGGEHVVAVSLADKEVGRPSTDPNLMGAGRVVDNGVIGSLGTVVPGELPANVNGGTVAIFGCDSTGLASQYSGANNYVSVDSGADKFTSTDGLLSAGGAFVNDLAQGKSLNTAVSDANKNLDKNPKTDIGDKVVKEQQQ